MQHLQITSSCGKTKPQPKCHSVPAVKHCEMGFFVCLFFNVSMLSESEQVHVVWLSFCGPDKTKKKSHRHRHFELLMFNSKASQAHTHENFMKQQVFVF